MLSSSAPITAHVLGLPITEKLSKNNIFLWKMQVLPAICGAQLAG
jgi:hypothetical protein